MSVGIGAPRYQGSKSLRRAPGSIRPVGVRLAPQAPEPLTQQHLPLPPVRLDADAS